MTTIKGLNIREAIRFLRNIYYYEIETGTTQQMTIREWIHYWINQ